MRETKSRVIDGVTYEVTQLGAKVGRLVLNRLAKVIGAAADSDTPVADFTRALTDEDLTYLCDTFAAMTTCEIPEAPGAKPGLAGVFDMHFAARYDAMLQWLWFCVEVNFASFLERVGLSTEKFQAGLAKANPSNSPKGPTGLSGV